METLRYGYAIVSLSDRRLIESVVEGMKAYFSKQEEEKQKQKKQGEIEWGYNALENKESFSVRNKALPEALKECIPYAESIHALAKEILQYVAKELGLESKTLLHLIEEKPLPNTGKSHSLLRLLHYYDAEPKEEQCGCGIHEDLGLLTLLPRANVPALEVFDFRKGEWIDIESQMGPTDVLVMVGESLSKISNGYYVPCPHRVRQPTEARYSAVYQVRVSQDASMDSTQYESPITGAFSTPFNLTGQSFLQQEINRRTSVNGSY